MDKLDFLETPEGVSDPVQPVETEALIEQPVETASETPQEAPTEQPRDDQGRFAPKPTETPVEASQQPQVPPGYVPINALHEARNRIRQLEAAQQPTPDIFEDTNGYLQQEVMQPLTSQITQLNLNWSRRFAEQAHTADTVAQAEQWVLERNAADPSFGQKILSDPDPYGAAVREYKQSQVLSRLDDPARIDAFLAWEAAQKAAQQQPAAPAATPQQPMPTRSLASAPSSGGAAHVPSGPGQAFDNLFRN